MFRYMKRHPFRLLGTLGLNFLGFALITATTILDQMLIDAVTEGKDNAFTFYLPLSLVGTLVAVALVVVAGVCYARYVVRTTGEIRQDAFGGLMRKCVADFRQAPVGDYISALTNDVRNLKQHYFNMLQLLVVSVVSGSVSIVLMFFYQPIVALCALLSCAACSWCPCSFPKSWKNARHCNRSGRRNWYRCSAICSRGLKSSLPLAQSCIWTRFFARRTRRFAMPRPARAA